MGKLDKENNRTEAIFELERVEFQSIMLRIVQYEELKKNTLELYKRSPYSRSNDHYSVIIAITCDKRLLDLKAEAYAKFLYLSKMATTQEQFEWIYEEKEIVSARELYKVLQDNRNFKINKNWADFMNDSGILREMYRIN